MTWISDLVETYDNNADAVGVIKDTDDVSKVLLPIFHLTANANVEVTITNDGEFYSAERLGSKDNARITIIPITEASAGRTSSTIAPMPLFDGLIYMAGDYEDRSVLETKNKSDDTTSNSKKSDAKPNSKKNQKDSKKCFQKYIDQLGRWAQDPDAPDQVKAIYKYLSKRTLLHDLVSHDIYTDKKNGTVRIKEKDFVRINVLYPEATPYHTDFWKYPEFQKKYIKYYSKQLAGRPQSVDYITGTDAVLVENLPAKIRNSGDKAKIISSNDEKGYTYRGRFLDANEACGVGLIESQKAFNALRWLIATQGYTNGSEAIVCWSVKGQKIPDIYQSPLSLFDDEEDLLDQTSQEYAKRINKALRGKYADIDSPQEKIIVMALDTATGAMHGRLAITYYNAINGSQFLKNIEEWYRTCNWYFQRKSGLIQTTPSLMDIALAAYGVERAGKLEASSKQQCSCAIDSLIPCIIRGQRLPSAILKATVSNCSSPLRFAQNKNGHRANWEAALSTTIALINRHKCEEKGDFNMDDKRNDTDRSYLFGKLLAVGVQAEKYANYINGSKRAVTNAERYWNAFTRNPARTWAVIQERLNPYLTLLKKKGKDYYSPQLEDIVCRLNEINGFTNKPLSEMYLPGYYYAQRASYQNRKNTEETEK